MIYKNALFCIYIFFNIICASASPIKIICTAALVDKQYDQRKAEYIKSITAIKNYGYEFFIVESCRSYPTFLDDLSGNVWYTKTNNPQLRNKGVNEAMALLRFFEDHKFNDEDIIVKLTGRYFLANDNFIKFISNNLNCDAFVKYVDNDNQIFTGCFAMKYYYLIKFLKQLDFQSMEKNMINIEKELARYLDSSEQIKICKLNILGIQARIAFGDDAYNL